ncbi:MAG TPA: 4Fe-4S dicluster domain-containing protein [Coriobacteriia bacterium]|nr:4Fe-4S dicluster domain-containing protein [Coriobacteriia bacterium]
MGAFCLEERDFGPFVEALRQATRVVGPVAKGNKFVFDELASVEDLRLDYDVTILPPKKVFFPTRQEVVRFDAEAVTDCIDPVDTVLLGVHPYDMRGIDMTDLLFRERNEDWNYLAQREATTIVASNVRTVAPRAFWASMIEGRAPQGHDAMLTNIDGGYVLEVRTPRGEALLAYGNFREATLDEVEAAERVDLEAFTQCQEQLPYSAAAVAEKVREAFGNEELWDRLSKDCFGCGSCNIVCPTCYCFDVRDMWNIDQATGQRTRYWDACLTREFAAVTQAGGLKENFREHHQSRFRHRFMRKAAYQFEKLGGPACTGCGRCSAACTIDIADPVRVITAIMEA